jgi:hypothetical protein
MLKRARPCEIVSLSVTHDQSGAAILLRVFGWRGFCFTQPGIREKFDIHRSVHRNIFLQ